jgi:CopG family transcriptional regulator, nickel-responsive regulator
VSRDRSAVASTGARRLHSRRGSQAGDHGLREERRGSSLPIRRPGNGEPAVQRITISIDDDLLETIDRLCDRRGYASRSEALRDIVRDVVSRDQVASEREAPCIAALTYVFEHQTRDLAKRLTEAQHAHHDLSVAALHVHIDEQDCLEVAILKGSVGAVRGFADSLVTQRGVRHGQLQIIPTGPGHDAPGHRHD